MRIIPSTHDRAWGVTRKADSRFGPAVRKRSDRSRARRLRDNAFFILVRALDGGVLILGLYRTTIASYQRNATKSSEPMQTFIHCEFRLRGDEEIEAPPRAESTAQIRAVYRAQ